MIFRELYLVMMRRGSASSRSSREVAEIHRSVPLPVHSKCCFWKPVKVKSVWIFEGMDVISMQAIWRKPWNVEASPRSLQGQVSIVKLPQFRLKFVC